MLRLRLAAFVFICGFALSAQSIELPAELSPGQKISGRIKPGEAKINTFVVSRTVLGIVLNIKSVQTGAELIIRNNSRIVYDKVIEEKEHTVRLAWWTKPALESGIYTVELFLPENAPLDYLYTLSYSVFDKVADYRLTTGSFADIKLLPEQLGFALCEILVPDKTPALRIDITDSDIDTDLFLFLPGEELEPGKAAYKAVNPYGRETIIVEKPAAGTYRLLVGSFALKWPFSAKIRLKISPDTKPPSYKPAEQGGSYAMAELPQAVVHLFSAMSEGTGVIISPEYILTASHVVSDDVVIAISSDSMRPAREELRGKTVYRDNRADLALVKISGDFYGRKGQLSVPEPLIISEQKIEYTSTYQIWGYSPAHSISGKTNISRLTALAAGFELVEIDDMQVRFIKLQSEVPSGFSGSPVLGPEGEIQAIITRTLSDEGRDIAIAVPADYVKEMLKKAGVK